MSIFTVYDSLSPTEQKAIEHALDDLGLSLWHLHLRNDDSAARAAEALAVYINESR